MSHRVQLVLPEPIARQLHEFAAESQEPPATVAAQMLRGAIAHRSEGRPIRHLRVVAPPASASAQRAPWLEPFGGDPAWRAEMWGAIAALYGRYTNQLEQLKNGWWMDDTHVETLSALAVWRAEIDDCGRDPREELAFHAQLAAYAALLRQQASGVAETWTPGPPPPDWT